jgi:BNR repeat-like domain
MFMQRQLCFLGLALHCAFWPIVLLADSSHEFTAGKLGASPSQPRLGVAPDGSVYLVYGADNSIFCAYSRDGGKTFSTPVLVANEGVLSLGMRRGPRIAAAKDYLVITAVVSKQGRGRDGDLLSWRSGDRGKTWSKAVAVNDTPNAAREGLHGMAAGPENVVIATWLDVRGEGSAPAGTQLYAAISRDGGQSWGANVLVYRSPDGTICECCHPSVVSDQKGGIYVMWRNALKGARDMYFSSSSDNGKTFTTAKKIGEGTWRLEACPMDGGDMAISPTNGPETVWRRGGQIFLAPLNSTEQILGSGKDPVIAWGTNGRYVAWHNTTAKGLVVLAPGASAPIQLGSKGSYVNLVTGPEGSIIATWEEGDQASKAVKVQLLR